MKAVVSKKNLLDGVRTAGHAINQRTALPMLSHLLISTQEEALRFQATDTQLGIAVTVPAQILDAGEMTVPAGLAAEIAGSLPEADAMVESSETNQATIKCGSSEFQILGLAPGDFPGLPDVSDSTWLEIPAKDLRTSLRRTTFACSTDELRTALLGVLFAFSGDTLRLVATDTHRLALDERMTGTGQGQASAIVPARAVNELLRILPEDGSVRVHISERQISFSIANLLLTASLIEGEFPKYDRVIPQDFERRIVAPTAILAPAVRRAGIVARSDMNRVVLKAHDDKLEISSRSGSVGRATEAVEAVLEGDPIEIAFSSEYLADALDAIETEGVQIQMSGALDPAVIRPVDQDDYLCVVMPMQLQEEVLPA